MKIFSQSTACALIAVANARTQHADPLPTTDGALFIPINGGTSSCIGGGGSKPYCKYELYGGWDLPVPPPTSELESEEPMCFMGHLPRRGETGKIDTRIDCFSNEMTAFRNGNGPTGFTGFVRWMHLYVVADLSGIPKVIPDDKCWLVANGKLTPILENCRNAVENTEPDRHVVEDLSASNAIERFPHEFYY